jgi:polyhydroxyalkanoate synthesis regulator phasin
VTPKIPAGEREFVREELYFLANRLVKNCKLTVAESKQVISEILRASV